MDLIIEGDPAELEWLRRQIESDVGSEAEVEQIPDRTGEELREPLTVALIVALGGPKLIQAIADVLKRRYQHQEEIERIRAELRVAELSAHGGEREPLRLRTDSGTAVTEQDLAAGSIPS
jgi:hypothetical protein